MDWSVCIICQSRKSDPLKCPMDSPQCNGIEIYNAFIQNFTALSELTSLPPDVTFTIGANSTPENLAHHKARWHKVCHMKFSNEKVERAKKKRKLQESSDDHSRIKRTYFNKDACVFCTSSEGDLHQVSTLEVDKTVRMMAVVLHDGALLARLEGGDMIATEAKYHTKCMVGLRTRYRSELRRSEDLIDDNEETEIEDRAFIELMSYIQASVEDGSYIFKLTDLFQMFTDRVQCLSGSCLTYKSRFKSQIMNFFPGQIQVQTDGKHTVLVFNRGLSSFLKKSLNCEKFESKAAILAEAASIVRDEMFEIDSFRFQGEFPPNCQSNYVPTTLKCLVSMLLNGPNLNNQDKQDSQACLTISQLITFNSKKKPQKQSIKARHSRERETPIPLYLGLSLHARTRSKVIIHQLASLGMCVSYDRVLEVTNSLATAVCEKYEEEGVVCPTNLRKGLFTVGALDNIDHNPTSTTAQSSFHGTGISLFQFSTNDHIGISRPKVKPDSSEKEHWLPDEYTIVPAAAAKISEISIPESTSNFTINQMDEKESNWIQHGIHLLERGTFSNDDKISWAAYHAMTQTEEINPCVISGLLPLFYEKSSSIAMIRHGMDVQRRATEFLNPGQIPITAFDQPLFALAKVIQWKWPETYGERMHVVMMGGLHIEMALWNTLGDLLEGSGWTSVLTEAGVASSGTANSFLKAVHLTKTRHSHQVTALSLAKLKDEAFKKQTTEDSQETWTMNMKQKSPTFQFWDMILMFELLILTFVRAHRENNFSLYVETLEKLVPLFFALDHVNYSRWVPIHIRDMKSLPENVKDDFEKFWVIPKTLRRFSCIPIDQAHEQHNAILKGSGGIVGLTENPTAFRRWTLCGPELTRLVTEFEESVLLQDVESNLHHEQGLSAQITFYAQVTNLSTTINDMGNPFCDDFPDLVTLDTRTCMDECVVRTVRTIEATGIEQYNKYVDEVIVKRSRGIQKPIKRNSLPLFKRQNKTQIKSKQQVSALKTDCNLFSKLYIAAQYRQGDLQSFFSHENHPYPPSLSDFGQIHFGKKSDLLSCIVPDTQLQPPRESDVKIFDGPAIVHALPITGAATFEEYADNIFLPFLKHQLRETKRVDIIWDIYKSDSLKESTREKRGSGIRRKVHGQGKMPGNWKDFLHNSSNKEELFAYLTKKTEAFRDVPVNKELIITSGSSVVYAGGDGHMPECNHEEADTRIVLHVQDALRRGAKTVIVRTVDTDVVTILVGCFPHLWIAHPSIQVWIAFGMGKSFCHYHVNSIHEKLQTPVCQALPIFHALSGSDTTSAFFGKGKKSFWDAWKAFPEVTDAFIYIQQHPFVTPQVSTYPFSALERLIVVLYDRTSTFEAVNDARRDLFVKNNRSLENIPPTQDALLQHVKRAIYQASIWSTCLQPTILMPPADTWGWTKLDGTWRPVWTTLPEAYLACTELVMCACRKGCNTQRCKCNKKQLTCTELCHCTCDN